jgi:hypothetical protein
MRAAYHGGFLQQCCLLQRCAQFASLHSAICVCAVVKRDMGVKQPSSVIARAWRPHAVERHFMSFIVSR